MLFISSVFASPDCVGATKQSKVILCIKANPILSQPPIPFDVAQGQAPLPSLLGVSEGLFLMRASTLLRSGLLSFPAQAENPLIGLILMDSRSGAGMTKDSGAGMTIEDCLRREDRE